MESGKMKPQLNRQAFKILVFLWVPFVAGAYYVVHKPWGSSPPLQPLWAIVDLILAGALIALTGGIGKRLLSARLEGLHPLERAAVEAALGLLALSMTVLIVGLIGWLRVPALWALLLLSSLGFGRSSVRWLAQLRAVANGWREWGPATWSACLTVVLLLTISLLSALSPPTAWDSLVYHLELPKQYLAAGSVGFNPDNLFVGFPQLAEMIYTWGLALRAAETAAVTGWMVGVLGLLATVGFARRILGEGIGWLPAAILLTGESLWQGLSWAYVDHWVLLFGMVAFLTLDLYTRGQSRAPLTVAGLAAGCALATKYTGGLVTAGCGLFLLHFHVFQRHASGHRAGAHGGQIQGGGTSIRDRPGVVARVQPLLRDLLILGSLTALVAAPWLLRNTFQMGNPLYPFFFPGKQVDALRQLYQAQQAPQRGLLDALLLPWQATVLGIDGGPRFNTSIGPLLLALIPGAIFGLGALKPAGRQSIARLAVVALALWLVWAAGAAWVGPLTRSRHYYGFLPALAVLAAGGYQALRSLEIGSVKAGWILSRFLIFVFALTALSAVLHLGRISPVGVLTGARSRQHYLEDQLGWYARVVQELNRLPPGSRVRFLWEPRAYYCRVDCVPDVILDQWWYLGRTVGPPSNLATTWSDEGVSHVLIYDQGVRLEQTAQPLLTEADWNALEVFREQELTLVREYGDGVYSLYELH